ncbi:MATE efflux family protein 1 [Dendrobium catenatum]|uniref:Protein DETOXIFICATION n=1 Tax=Dendrobium catenatum TaxID=906689 RepID=A0A2I0W319_9ASPA|nr:MATE efflux family protein 1 [Dendrobium catenatum]
MENTHDSSNKVLCVQDNLNETRRTPHVLVNESETTTNDKTVDGVPILSAPVIPRKTGIYLFFHDIRCVFKLDELGREVARIAIPAALALAADPLASLIDTAFIGRLGSVELAAVGVSIAIFNQVSKVAIYPLVSVTTSFVAEEDALCSNILEEKGNADLEKATVIDETKVSAPSSEVSDAKKIGSNLSNIANTCTNLSTTGKKRKFIPSVSTALFVGVVLGMLQAILLIVTAKFVLHVMGVKRGSPMLAPAMRYLTLRSLGAPAVLLSLSMQGVFRGFKDTRTPLYATMAGDLTNIILDPILIFVFHMGVSGAAIAHVISQLINMVDIVPHSMKSFKFARFLRCGFLLLARVIAVTFCVTMAASLAAHHGPTPMAAFQICLQVWLSTSLLADGLAVAGQLSIVLGLALSALLGFGLQFGSGIFTKDINVIKQVHKAIPFVAGTQTINSLAFVFDGVNFGASDYTFSAYSMVAVAAVSIPSLIFLSNSHGFVGIWIALTIYMSLRTLASVWRMGSATGPWTFIRK